jgi:hypothetical protein
MRNTSNRIVLTALAASLLLGPGVGVSCAQPVIVERAMPAPIVEVVPPAPRVGLAWVPGHWVCREGAWFWVKGHYVEGVVPPMPAPVVEVRPVAPSPKHVWVRGHWGWEGTRWNWHPGIWFRP